MPPLKIIVSLIFLLLCTVAGIVVWMKLPPRVRLLPLLFLLSFSVTLYGHYHRPNGWLYNLYFPIEFAAVVFTLSAFLSKRFVRKTYPAITTIFMAIWLGFFLNNGIELFAFIPYLFGCLFISGISLSVLYNMTVTGIIKTQKRVLVLCAALLIYFAGVIPLFGILKYLNQYDSETAYKLYFNINWILSLIRYFLICIFFLAHLAMNNKQLPSLKDR